MSDEPGPLPAGLLDRLASRPGPGLLDRPAWPAWPDPGLLAADLAVLRDGGYLALALPARHGGAGLSLAQVACAQRQLAARAPATAAAVNAHHAWVGAAADALASGHPAGTGPAWVLREAARGRLFAGYGAGRGPETPDAVPPDLIPPDLVPPDWDWLAVRSVDRHEPRRPAVVYGFAGRAGAGFRPVSQPPLGGPGPQGPGDALIAGMYAWGLSLAGMTSYAIARQAFGLAVERARGRYKAGRGRDGHDGGGGPDGHDGHPLDRWPVAEAALRLDDIRGQLDEVIAGWQRRVAAGGGMTSLDPGGLGLIRQFTARHVAADGARRVIGLAAPIAGDAVGAARA